MILAGKAAFVLSRSWQVLKGVWDIKKAGMYLERESSVYKQLIVLPLLHPVSYLCRGTDVENLNDFIYCSVFSRFHVPVRKAGHQLLLTNKQPFHDFWG